MENICKNLNIRGEYLKLFDIKSSNTLDILNSEFNKFGEYILADTINFKKDDVMFNFIYFGFNFTNNTRKNI